MKNVRRSGLGLALGLGLSLLSVGLAQSATQSAQTTKTESCCAMASSCKDCKGESCSTKDHSKAEHAKDPSAHPAKHGCCCSGDTCNTKTSDSQKHHSVMEGCCCCTGDSCSMNHEMKDHAQKDHTKKDHAKMHAATHADMDGCCCSGDSCDMKMTHDMPEKPKV